ncbi:MAG: ABC transporter substrate-binding protein, partial [Pseudomonadota bacterium]
DALAVGQIDGYCVGEPWNSLAVKTGAGCILTTKSEIWHSSPEKVLGVRSEWARQNPELLTRLIRALFAAARWCGEIANRDELASLLARPEHVDVAASVAKRALDGNIETSPDKFYDLPDFMVPFDRAATFPWQSHALWIYSQMVRWGQIEHTAQNLARAKDSYRPDIYRRALENTGAAIPSANMKVEGALKAETPVGSTGRLMLGPDGFFDDRVFDPDRIDDYLASLI